MRTVGWRRGVAILAALATLAAVLLPPVAAWADSTIEVTTTADDAGTATAANCPGAACTLRDAVAAADGMGGPVTIDLPPGTYVLSGPGLNLGTAHGADVTLLGTGPAGSTVVEQTYHDRVLDVDPDVAGNVSVTIRNVGLTGGSAGDYGGGAILAGGPKDVLNVVATAVYANSSTTNGGGIAFEGGGQLTITDSTIANNGAPTGDGGGLFVGQAASLTVTGSTVSGNTATGFASGGGQGGGMFVEMAPRASASISSSTLTANTADGDGGGLFVSSGAPALSLDRIAGNSAPSGGGLDNIGPQMTATDVWWGCNSGPGAAGCDTVHGDVTSSPRMVLQASTVASTAYSGQAVTVTADMTHDSSGATPGAVPDGTPVAFTSAQGTLNPPTAGLAGGLAGSTFTVGGTPGLATIAVTVDGQTVDAHVNVLADVPPVVTTNPVATLACAGGPATFTAAASGTPPPTVQWQSSVDGAATWLNVAGATYATLDLSSTAAGENTVLYQAVFTNRAGNATSAPAVLSVDTAAEVTEQPTSVKAVATTPVSFSAAGSGGRDLRLQWQVDSGGMWTDIGGATAATLHLTATPAENGNQYRAELTDACGTVATDAATLTVTQATPSIAWTAPVPVPDGTALGPTQLDATASFDGGAVAGAFSYQVDGQPASGLVLAPGHYTLDATFTPSDTADFASASAKVSLSVLPPPTVTGLQWAASPQTGQLASTWSLSFSTSLTGALSVGQAVYVTAPAGTVLPAAPAAYTVNGTVAGAVYGGAGNSVRVIVPAAVAGSAPVSLQIAGVLNPPAGTYPAADLAVTTSADSIPANPSAPLTFAPLPDGTGAVTVSPAAVVAGSTGNTLTFTFTAGADGTVAGSVYLTVPGGWSGGAWTAGLDHVSVSGQTVVVSDVTLGPSGRLMIIDAGAVAPATAGPSEFGVSEASSASGAAQPLAPVPVQVVAPLTAPAGALPDATVGTFYRQTLAASGGTPPYTWSLTGGTLAAGLTFDTVAGAVYGTPAAAGAVTLQIGVADSVGRTAQGSVTLRVLAAPSGPPGGGANNPPSQPTGISVGTGGGTLTTQDGGFTLPLPAGAIPPGQIMAVAESCPAPGGLPTTVVVLSCAFTVSGPRLALPELATLVPSRPGVLAGAWAVYVRGGDGVWRYVPTRTDAAAGRATVDVTGPETLVVVGPAALPSDVEVGYWAAPAIGSLLAAGVVDGYPDGTFRPGDAVTRAQFVKMLDLSLGLQIAGGQTPFADVNAAAWYAPYVAAAVRAGFVEGTSPTTFSPDAPVTRQEVAVLLARALKLSGTSALRFSDDGQIASWALGGVEGAVADGLLVGYPDGSFRPAAPATRAEAAAVLAAAIAAMVH